MDLFNKKRIAILKEDLAMFKEGYTKRGEEIDRITALLNEKKESRMELKKRIEEEVEFRHKNSMRKVEIENEVLKQKVEILEKAFENMGFDVKDMKGMLDKLVDGIISGNKINVIK